jgi:hypothetical protein
MLLVLLDASLAGLQSFVVRNTLGYPTDYRLAFRELGLSIGLHAAKKTKDLYERQKNIGANMHKVAAKVEDLVRFVPVGGVIEDFWLDNAHQMSETWMEHRDINMVMLATSLTPDTYLTI